MTSPTQKRARKRPRGVGLEAARAPAGASWEERCAVLFEDLRKPARVMIARAWGRAFSATEVEDVYASAWTSTLAALRGRAERMDDEELRSYLLTAVAGHASKEMRRRSRRPTSELSDAHAQIIADAHAPGPEERAVGSESSGVARDLLASLPERRRAVMLLRYGWGLEPAKICALLPGLSPRAYRKEVTRGVGELIERLRAVESGEWCRSREPIIRDYVAGTVDEASRRQAVEHLGHCRHCGELVGRLNGSLSELGSLAAWTSLGGVGESELSLLDRAGGVVDRGREIAASSAERAEGAAEAATALTASGAGRGAGAAGAGVLAKLAGLGAAGKVAVGCISAGAAASACLATGVVGPIGKGGGGQSSGKAVAGVESVEAVPVTPSPSVDIPPIIAEPAPESGEEGGEGEGGPGGDAGAEGEAVTAPEGAPRDSAAPLAPADQQEFGLPAAVAATGGGGSPAGSGSGGSGSGGSGSGGSGSGGKASKQDVASEFGP